ncbi:MAG: type I glyceraldehyde-3-phosphate dehydrogenase [candidate division WOR-3 bacterium]
MAKRVGINGFGRIGRLVLRIGYQEKDLDFVAINDVAKSEVLAHLFKYDSVHRTFPGEVKAEENSFFLNGKEIRVFTEKEPENLKWKDLGVEIVVEATGKFLTFEDCQKHLENGAKKVVITAPPKGEKPIKSIVMGVNEETYNPKEDHIISAASCTTNCVVPIIKILHENFKIIRGYMTTIHAYTNDQRILDSPHKDLRRARACNLSMIPTTTGATKMIGVIYPELKGKIDGIAIRVPTPDVSFIDLSCEVEKRTSKEEVNEVFRKASEGKMKRYLQYLTEPLVSIDLTGSPYSAIFDSLLTTVVDNHLVKVFAWYDNEWGYSYRVVDLIKYVVERWQD